jgi:anaphase-promoting complex subunit 5
MDDLWTIKAAIDMGEAAHVAFRRTYRALARHEHVPSKHSNKDTRECWVSRHEFDVAAWHAAQAGLWDMMGMSAVRLELM